MSTMDKLPINNEALEPKSIVISGPDTDPIPFRIDTSDLKTPKSIHVDDVDYGFGKSFSDPSWNFHHTEPSNGHHRSVVATPIMALRVDNQMLALCRTSDQGSKQTSGFDYILTPLFIEGSQLTHLKQQYDNYSSNRMVGLNTDNSNLFVGVSKDKHGADPVVEHTIDDSNAQLQIEVGAGGEIRISGLNNANVEAFYEGPVDHEEAVAKLALELGLNDLPNTDPVETKPQTLVGKIRATIGRVASAFAEALDDAPSPKEFNSSELNGINLDLHDIAKLHDRVLTNDGKSTINTSLIETEKSGLMLSATFSTSGRSAEGYRGLELETPHLLVDGDDAKATVTGYAVEVSEHDGATAMIEEKGSGGAYNKGIIRQTRINTDAHGSVISIEKRNKTVGDIHWNTVTVKPEDSNFERSVNRSTTIIDNLHRQIRDRLDGNGLGS